MFLLLPSSCSLLLSGVLVHCVAYNPLLQLSNKQRIAKACFRTLIGTGTPAQWPDRNRYVKGVFKHLCRIHQRSKTTQGSTVSRWNLILSDYTRIRNLFLSNFRVMSATSIQLYQVNMTTLTQWHNSLEKQTETAVLHQTDLQKPLPDNFRLRASRSRFHLLPLLLRLCDLICRKTQRGWQVRFGRLLGRRHRARKLRVVAAQDAIGECSLSHFLFNLKRSVSTLHASKCTSQP